MNEKCIRTQRISTSSEATLVHKNNKKAFLLLDIKQIVICIRDSLIEEETKEFFSRFTYPKSQGIRNDARKFVIQWLSHSAHFYRNSCEIYKC